MSESVGQPLNAIGVIPARWGSTRFPGKPLELIAGRPLLSWVIRGAKKSQLLSEVWVATDDERIAKLAADEGVITVMTDTTLETGTDRVWQACERRADFLRSSSSSEFAAARPIDVVLNIQGDEPLIQGELLDALLKPFTLQRDLEMATLGRTLDEAALHSPNTAKIVMNCRNEAIYFSRFPIPFSRESSASHMSELARGTSCLKHIGIYAYSFAFLKKFCGQTATVIERLEGLEQLRALYLGAKIKVVRVENDSWGVDIPDDILKIEKLMKGQNL